MTILGGMLTLIGSSTNLLVAMRRRASPIIRWLFPANADCDHSDKCGTLHFFVMPRIIGETEVEEKATARNRPPIYYRIALAHWRCAGGQTRRRFLPALSGMTLQIIERGGETFLPPFDDITLAPGDRLFVAATRKEISDALASKDHPCRANFCLWCRTLRRIAMTKPFLPNLSSRRAHAWRRAVHQTGFTHDTGCFIIGVQRRRRMLRHELTENRLEAGDVLLVIGRQANIESLRDNRDTLLMEWSRVNCRVSKRPSRAPDICGTVLSAATGLVPIVAASVAGATLMVVSGVLNVRQASRGFDLRIFLVVAAALAMSHALFVSGGASSLPRNYCICLTGMHRR